MVDMHHIVSDGISVELFTKEFKALYGGEKLPPLRLQYKDYAQAQKNREADPAFRRQEEYWLHRFKGEIPVLNLFTDFPRPAVQGFAGKVAAFELNTRETTGLKEIARAEKATLFMTLLAVYAVFLAKISGQEDIIVGTPTAGRRHADLEQIIGMFVGTLPLRNYPAAGKTFKEFLQQIKERTIMDFENQDYPFEKLVEKVNIERDAARNPLFDAMLMYQDINAAPGEILKDDTAGIKIKPYPYEHSTAKFELTLTAVEKAAGLFFSLGYCTALYKDPTIARWTGNIKRIIAQVTAAPVLKLSQIEIISEQEKHLVLQIFNETPTPYAAGKTLMDLFTEQAERNPHRAALTGRDPGPASRRQYNNTVTYRECHRGSGQWAGILREKGAAAEDVVGIMMGRSLEMVIAILGILKAGAAYLPIDPGYPAERIRYLRADSGAKILVTDGNWAKEGEKVPLLPAAGNRPPATTLAYIIYTSGSTGSPKGVLVEHRSLMNTLLYLSSRYPCSGGDNYLLKTSFLFDVSVTELLGWFIRGGSLTVLAAGAEKEPAAIVDVVERTRVTHINFVPSMFNVFVQEATPREIPRLSGLKYVFLAGEAMWPGLVTAARALLPGVILENLYGPTEAAVYAGAYSLQEWQDGNIPIGKPLNNVRLFIIDKSGNLQPVGIPGELVISGAGTARGYLNRTELTAEKFLFKLYRSNRSYRSYIPKKLYQTGDLARWYEDGNIEFLGRIDHQVKIRGFRIELGEIENRLLKHEHIKEAVVLVKETGTDRNLCAYYVTDRDFSPGQLREFLSRELPEYMLPGYYIKQERLPLTTSGKVDRKALPAPGIVRGSEFIAPRDEIEGKIAGIWSGVLGQPAGIDDNFFEIGGHSLKATVIAARIYRELGIKIPPAQLFKTPTIRGLAAFITGTYGPAAIPAYDAVEPGEKRGYYTATSSQQRFYIQQQITPGSTVNNIPLVLHPKEKPDREKLAEAFRRLLKRHEALRTSFHLVNEQVVQVVHDEVEFEIENAEAMIKNFLRPFDLSRAPLVRVGLEPNESILIIDMHHIISDGTSVQVLGRELMALYRGESLPVLRLQYKDFCQWQHRLFRTGQMKAHEDYWLNQLKGPLPGLDLPTDYPRTESRTSAGQTYRIGLEKSLPGKLYELGRSTGTTLYMILLAVYNILLYKYTGQKDIMVGSPVAGRNHADLENIIGLIMESIVIRNLYSEYKTFGELLREIKDKTLAAYEHQAYPYDELLKKLAAGGHNPRGPLTPVALIVQNMVDPALAAYLEPDAREFFIPGTSKLDLTITAWEMTEAAGQQVLLEFEYGTQLFKPGTIMRLAGHLIDILKQVAENPGTRLEEILLISKPGLEALTGGESPCYRLSHAQKRIYALEKTFPGTSVGTLAFTVRYDRELRRELLEAAINHMLQKHQGIRLRIIETPIEPQPHQYVAPFKPYHLEVIDFSKSEGETGIRQWIEADTAQPFQFLNSALFYFVYIRYNDKETGYYMKVHHIVVDGWAAYMLIAGINSVYEALAAGQALVLTPAPSYIQYLEDEREYLRSTQAAADREFWHRTLTPLPEELTLSDRHYNYTNIKGRVCKLTLPSPLRDRVRQYCETQRTSIYKLVCGALSIYLFRTTGKEDMVLGSASHNRSTEAQKQMTGMFVGTLPIRIQTPPGMMFRDLVEEIGTRINYIVKNHQRYPYDRLMEEIREETGTDPNYLLNINLIGHGDLREGAYKIEHHFAGHDPSHLTIHINNRIDREELELEWVYREEILTLDRVERIHRGLVNILEDALARPTGKLSGLELLSGAEKKQILNDWNETETPGAEGQVCRLIKARAERTPDHTVLLGMSKPSIGPRTRDADPRQGPPAAQGQAVGQLSYKELEEKAGQLATLLTEQGVEPDTIVAIMTEPGLEMIIGLLGILESGAAYLPIEPGTPDQRTRYILADSGAKILVTTGNIAVLPGFKTSQSHNYPHLPAASRRPPATSLAYIIYTSGSTGRPKGVAVEHRNLSAYLNAFDREFHPDANDIVIQQASFAFDAFVEELYPILWKGGKLVIPGRDQVLDIDLLCRFIHRHRVTIITCSPLLMSQLNKQKTTGLLGTIRLFISGADRLNKAYIDRLPEPGAAVVYNTYGPTETTVCATYYKCQTGTPPLVPIGKPIANYKVYVLDRFENPQPVGVGGELCITGPGVTRGYLNNPGLTAEKFCLRRPGTLIGTPRRGAPGPRKSFLLNHSPLYQTGDLARWLPEGNIEFLGRIDQQVKIRGYRIEMEEIENQLLKHKEIKEAVVNVQGEMQEKSLYAYIVPHSPGNLNKSGLREYLTGKLPAYMIPDYFIQVKNIPLTPQGKVDRKKLNDQEGNRLESKETFVAPHTGIEKLIAGAWLEVLGMEKIGLHDNFFESGGNSVKVTQLNGKLKTLLGRDIPMVEMYKYQTIHSFTGYLTAGEPGGREQGQEFLEKAAGTRSALVEKAKDKRKLQKDKRRRGN